MRIYIERAIDNLIAHGDTDIFPFPPENIAVRECKAQIIDLIESMHNNFPTYMDDYPPFFYNSLIPNGYTGFRWATQIDSFWNIYFLALVLSISEKIESVRIPTSYNQIHSYRFDLLGGGDLFDATTGWRSFYNQSKKLSNSHPFVVSCDISEFYRRVYHHRLENAIQHLDEIATGKRINRLLSIFSGGGSYGLPIGGPAARILSELLLDQTDHILSDAGIPFCRFADDFLLFANTRTEAYSHLLFLSEKLQLNQGLALQRAKTRVLSTAEFQASQPLIDQEDEDFSDAIDRGKRLLFSISLFFDPYSPSAKTDYEILKEQLEHLDVMGLLNHEIRKSRIHIPTVNRLVRAMVYLEGNVRDEAVLTIVRNIETFYPCLSLVIICIEKTISNMGDNAISELMTIFANLLMSNSYLVGTPVNRAFALRLATSARQVHTTPLAVKFLEDSDPIVRREALLALSYHSEWTHISDARHRFRIMTPTERRTMIIASYRLTDEGDHWRRSQKRTFDPFELFIMEWMDARVSKDIRQT